MAPKKPTTAKATTSNARATRARAAPPARVTKSSAKAPKAPQAPKAPKAPKAPAAAKVAKTAVVKKRTAAKKSATSAPRSKAAKELTNGHPTTSSSAASKAAHSKSKRKMANDDDEASDRPAKRAKTAPASVAPKKEKTPRVQSEDSPARSINSIPTKIMAIFSFGSGEMGELGLGPKTKQVLRPRLNPYLDPDDAAKFHIVDISCGGMHTVALTADNKIITWGVNDNSALGRNTSWDGGERDMDAESGSDDDEELNPHESTPGAIPESSFATGTKFVQVAAGDSCSFALTETGLVYGWGTFRNNEGKEGFCYDDRKQLIKRQDTPILISGLQDISQITTGSNHALALDRKGRIWAWGIGEQNQLGHRLFGRHQDGLVPRIVEVARNNVKYVASGQFHSFAVDKKDNVWAWGLNSFGEAGYAKAAGSDDVLLPYPMKIADLCGKGVEVISGGAHHSAAVTADGKAYVWGRMDGGQLGIEFSEAQIQDEDLVRRDERDKPRICLRPTEVTTIGEATYVACGTDHTIFTNRDGLAYSAGFNSGGQLGLGNEDDAAVMSNAFSKWTKEKMLAWAGAGGQFSVLAGTSR